jgi:transcriptional regulator with XRE-family HTH domain
VPRSTSLANDRQRRAFAGWLSGERERVGCSKTALAGALGYDSMAHVNKILSGKVMPMPETLRLLCDEMGISWAAAFAMAGYYGELLEALVDLVQLGTDWAINDGATRLDAFRSFGIIRIKEGHPLELFQRDKRIVDRYYVGEWRELELEIETPTTTVDGTPLSEADIDRMRAYGSQPRLPERVIVPKPTAGALLVACAGFPRRGDVYKDGCSVYAANLLEVMTPLISEAQCKSRLRRLPDVLSAAREALANRSLPFNYRRPIAAEYVAAWADSICSRFTHYARLATFDYWGEVGSSTSTTTPFVQLPQIRIASLPDLSAFTLGKDYGPSSG